MVDARPDLSIVTSLYLSAPYLREFSRRAREAAAAATLSYEIILVNDGSPDDSLATALQLRREDPRIRIIDLSRNFGHHKALMTGMARAAGELVFLIDCDLEEDPGVARRVPRGDAPTGADVIYGVQSSRKGRRMERATGMVFFRLFNRMLTHPIPPNIVTARLMSRRYVEALVQHEDREMFLAGLWVMAGFDQRPVTVHKAQPRRDLVQSAAPRLGFRQRADIVQQSAADLHLLPRSDDHGAVVRRRRAARRRIPARAVSGNRAGRRSWCRSGFSAV